MKIMLAFFLLFVFNSSFAQIAQRGDNISIVSNSQILFTYTSTDDLLHDKIISNAFQIDLISQNHNSSIYVSIAYAGHAFPKDPVLKLNHKTSSNSLDNGMIETPLTNQGQLLFIQPKIAGSNSYYYDLILHPSSSFIDPAIYKFSIIFTMTQP